MRMNIFLKLTSTVPVKAQIARSPKDVQQQNKRTVKAGNFVTFFALFNFFLKNSFK